MLLQSSQNFLWKTSAIVLEVFIPQQKNCWRCAGLSMGSHKWGVLKQQSSPSTVAQEPPCAILPYQIWEGKDAGNDKMWVQRWRQGWMGTHTHPPSELILIWHMITAALAMNAGSCRNHGRDFFSSNFLLAVSNKSFFYHFWAVIWLHAFLLHNLLPVLVSSHQCTLLETFQKVRCSAVKFQGCTKI